MFIRDHENWHRIHDWERGDVSSREKVRVMKIRAYPHYWRFQLIAPRPTRPSPHAIPTIPAAPHGIPTIPEATAPGERGMTYVQRYPDPYA